MVGNVFSWVEDCYHPNYEGAPTDRLGLECGCPEVRRRVIRGGSWAHGSVALRSAARTSSTSDGWGATVRFQVARTLSDPQGQFVASRR